MINGVMLSSLSGILTHIFYDFFFSPFYLLAVLVSLILNFFLLVSLSRGGLVGWAGKESGWI